MTKYEQRYKDLQKKFWLKYVIDRVFAVLFFILAAPFMLFVIVLIKIDGMLHPENKGNILYKEKRISAGKPFYILKFRTVTQETVNKLQSLEGKKSITGSEGRTWAGHIILKWYLDELPQIINILKGEMSFVGPRPHIMEHHQSDIKQGFVYRNYIKAGLLGVPQACKRHPKYQALFESMAKSNRSQNEALNKIDSVYAKKCLDLSVLGILLFDVSLIFRGLIVVFRGGATV